VRKKLIIAALVPTAFLVVSLAICWRIWTPIQGARKTFGWDAVWAYWGYFKFSLGALKHGQLPLWNPFDRNGYPWYADPQVGLLYPPNWIWFIVGAIFGTGYAIVFPQILGHFVLGASGMYLFLRRRGTPHWACAAAGVFFILTYPVSHAQFTALNWGLAWAPWMILTVDRWAEDPTYGRAAAVALTFGMCVLAGAEASFWYALIVVVPYGIWAMFHHRKPGYVKSALVAAALFGAIVAAQLGATGTLVPQTVRDQRDLPFIGTSAFTPDDLFGMLVPQMPGEGLYVTWVMAFGIAAAIAIRPKPRTLVLGGIAVLGGLLALGENHGFLIVLASAFKPFGFFRRAHRYLAITYLALGILGAEGLAALATDELGEVRARVKKVILWAGAGGLVIFGSFFVRGSHLPNQAEPFRDAYGKAFFSVAVSTCFVYLLVSSRTARNRAIFGWILASIVLFDLWSARFMDIDKGMHPVPSATHDREARALPGVPDDARIYDREYFRYRPGVRLWIRDFGGYEGDPLDLSRYAHLLDAAHGQPRILGNVGVRYVTEGPNTETHKFAVPTAGMRQIRGGVWEIPDALPAVAWTDDLRVVDDEGQVVPTMNALPKPGSAVLERRTLTADELGRVAASADAPVAGKLTSYRLNSLEAEIDAPKDGVVLIAESYFPGWSATVDGQPAHIVPANELDRAVFVGAGHHVIRMQFHAATTR
jgi:hypothetical protein